VEVNAGSGDPKIVVVGLPDASVRESQDRVTTAISNSGYRWPRSRTTVNLAPADLKKEGPRGKGSVLEYTCFQGTGSLASPGFKASAARPPTLEDSAARGVKRKCF
jgi:predicted ATPase with chaperone activity